MQMVESRDSRHTAAVALTVAFALGGCGSDSGEGEDGIKVTATVADPYVQGAVFCVDTDRSKSCEPGEPRSSTSTTTGEITFNLDEDLPDGTLIIADSSSLGTHNGTEFALEMSALVAGGTSDFVISPMTTLQARTAPVSGGSVQTDQVLTEDNIVQLLQAAGLTDITATDVTADPMENVSALSGTVTEAQLARIQAALSVYGFMRLFEQSNTLASLSPSEILASGLDTDGTSGVDNGVYQILSTMVGAVQATVSPGLITQAQTPITSGNTQLGSYGTLPDVTAEVIVKTGVAILDRVVGDAAAACNAGGGDYGAGLSTAGTLLADSGFPTLVAELGVSYYGAHNKDTLQNILNNVPIANDMQTLMGGAQLGTWLDTGIACSSGHFSVDANLNYSCIN